jgi:ATP adenylyltransferase
MNLYPYNNGHLMVAPALHAARLADLPEEVRRELMEEVSRWVEIIGRAMRPEGFNVGMNLGAPAGAGLADHLHIHVVPRWGGDTNFMPVTGQVKVISQSLEDAYRTLLDASRSRD